MLKRYVVYSYGSLPHGQYDWIYASYGTYQEAEGGYKAEVKASREAFILDLSTHDILKSSKLNIGDVEYVPPPKGDKTKELKWGLIDK